MYVKVLTMRVLFRYSQIIAIAGELDGELLESIASAIVGEPLTFTESPDVAGLYFTLDFIPPGVGFEIATHILVEQT